MLVHFWRLGTQNSACCQHCFLGRIKGGSFGGSGWGPSADWQSLVFLALPSSPRTLSCAPVFKFIRIMIPKSYWLMVPPTQCGFIFNQLHQTLFPNKVTFWSSGWTGTSEKHCAKHADDKFFLFVPIPSLWMLYTRAWITLMSLLYVKEGAHKNAAVMWFYLTGCLH